jgi:hypothetical protein
MIKAIKIFLIAVLSVVILFVLIVLRLFAIKLYDSSVQNAHMRTLKSYYQSEDFEPVNESDFVDFDLNDQTIRLNEIQMLATHNSYKKTGSDIGKFFVGLGDSFDEARALKYGYKNLTDQFEAGVRSMEFDLRLRKTQYVLTHVPLVDNSSVAPDFAQALEEIALFSSNHPNHVPIIILMEIKDDWMILDHALQVIESKDLENLNTLLTEKLGNQLFTPQMMMEADKTLKETIQSTGWPTLNSLLGKVIFVLHPGNFTDMYFELDETLETQPMFIGSYASGINQDYASFIVHNNPSREEIEPLIQANFIVRTRIDANLIFNQSDFDQAVLSGAQILTSDFLVGRKDIKTSDIIYFDDNKMIIRKTS